MGNNNLFQPEFLAPEMEFETPTQYEEEEIRKLRARTARVRRPTSSRGRRRFQHPFTRRPRAQWSFNYGSPPMTKPELPSEGNEYVRWVQATLNHVLNLQLPIDGMMNVQTRSAIRSFQEKNNLSADGIVGPPTEAALIAASKNAQPRQTVSEFEAFDFGADTREWEGEVNRKGRDYIKWVQQSLNQILGIRLTIDGDLGSKTRSAIRSFQQKQGLTADGIVGAKTEAAIKSALGQSGFSTSTGQRPAPAQPNSAQASVGFNTACEVIDRFDFNDPNVKERDPNHQRQLAQVVARLMAAASKASTPIPVRFIGHTDPVGSAAYNEQLGLKRATSARKIVMNKLNARPDLVARLDFKSAETRGEREPLPDKAASRRVQICFPILPQPTPPITLPKPPVTPPTPPKPVPTYPPAVRRWFKIGGQPRMPTVWAGNQVIPFVSGPPTFKSMVEAIRTAKGRGHFIYNIGCFYHDDFPLITGDSRTTMRSMLSSASQRGVQVRALLWDQFGRGNAAAVDFINTLPNGAAILDNRTISRSRPFLLNIGVHHQKILIVYGDQGLITFCGGMDINPNRLPSTSSPPSGSGGSGSGSGGGGKWRNPMHDVHCRIKGPAAHDLLRIFRERWEDQPDHSGLDRKKGRLLNAAQSPVVGQTYVQISRTYGNGRRHHKVPGGYRFAPFGEQSIRHMVLHAIQQARRFIYIEDQYLVNQEISQALVRALPNIQHLTIVIPHSSLLDSEECPQKHHAIRRLFIQALKKAGKSKVGVYYLAPKGAPGTYVHSKTWVIDDEFAVIGSANINRRGYTHDSEVAAGIYDPGTPSLVKKLRIALWSKHLNVSPAQLDNGVASRRFWLRPPQGAHIAPFNELAPISARDKRIPCSESWDDVIDPDGS